MSGQRSKKVRIGSSRQRAWNQSKKSEADDGIDNTDRTPVTQCHMAGEGIESLGDLAELNSSESGNPDLPSSDVTANRRKLGSRRRNKGRQDVKDSVAKSYHETREEVVENTTRHDALFGNRSSSPPGPVEIESASNQSLDFAEPDRSYKKGIHVEKPSDERSPETTYDMSRACKEETDKVTVSVSHLPQGMENVPEQSDICRQEKPELNDKIVEESEIMLDEETLQDESKCQRSTLATDNVNEEEMSHGSEHGLIGSSRHGSSVYSSSTPDQSFESGNPTAPTCSEVFPESLIPRSEEGFVVDYNGVVNEDKLEASDSCKSAEINFEEMGKFHTCASKGVCDYVRDTEQLDGTSQLFSLISDSAPSTDQLVDKSNSRGNPEDEALGGVHAVLDREEESEEGEGTMEGLKPSGNLKGNYLVSESPMKVKDTESPIREKNSPVEHNQSECTVEPGPSHDNIEQSSFTLPTEEPLSENRHNEHFILSQATDTHLFAQLHQSEDTVNYKVAEQEVHEPTQIREINPIHNFDGSVLHAVAENLDVHCAELIDYSNVGIRETYQSEIIMKSVDQPVNEEEIPYSDNKQDKDPTTQSNRADFSQRNEDEYVHDSSEPRSHKIGRTDTALDQVYDNEGQMGIDREVIVEDLVNQEGETLPWKSEDSASSLQTLPSYSSSCSDEGTRMSDSTGKKRKMTSIHRNRGRQIQESTDERLREEHEDADTHEDVNVGKAWGGYVNVGKAWGGDKNKLQVEYNSQSNTTLCAKTQEPLYGGVIAALCERGQISRDISSLESTLDVLNQDQEIVTNPDVYEPQPSWTSDADAPDTRQSRQDTLDRPEQNSDNDENPHIKSKSTGRRRKMGSTRRNLRDRHEEKNTEKMQEDETSLSQIIQVKTGGMTTEVDSSLEREDPIGSTERVSEDEKEKSLTGELENTSELTGYEEPEITEFLQSQSMLFHKEEDSQTSDKQTVSDCGDKGNRNSRQDTLDVLNPEVSQDQNTESISGDTQAARGEAYLEQTNEVKEMLEDFTVSDLMKIRPKHDVEEKDPISAEVVSEKDEVGEQFGDGEKEDHIAQELDISYEDTYSQSLPAAQNKNVLSETLDVFDISHEEDLKEIVTNPDVYEPQPSWTSDADAPDTRQSRQDTLDRPEQNSDDDENPHVKSKSTGRRRKMGSTRRNLRDRHEEKNTEKMQEDETSLSQIIQVKTGGMTTEVDSSLERGDPIGSTERVSEDEKEKSLTGELENTSELTGYEEPEITEFLQSQTMLFHKEEDSQTSDKQTVSDCGDKGNRNSRQDTLDVLNPEVSQDQNTESISGDTQAARGEAYLEQTNEVKEMLEDFTVSDLMKIRPKHDVEEKDPISAEVVSEKDEVGEQFGDGEKEDHIAQELDISYEDTYSQSLPAAQNKNVLSETLDVFDISHEEDLKEIVTNPDVYEPQPSWTSDADAPDTRQSRQDTLDRPEQNSDDDENPHIKSNSTGRRRKMGSTRRNLRDRHEEKNTEKMQEDETSLSQIIQVKTGGMTTEVDSSLEREDPIGSTERVSEDEKEKSLTGELENTSELTGYEEPEITEFLQSQSMLFHKEEDSQTSDKQTVSDCGDKGNRNSRQDTLDVLNPEVSQDQNTESISGDTQAARGEAYLEQTNEVKEMLEDFTVSDLMKIRPKHDVEEKDPISAEVVSEKDEVGEQFGDGEKEDHIAQELDISYEDTYSQSLPAAQNKNVLSETLDVFDISHEEDLKEIVTNPDVYEPQPSWTSDADAPDTRQSRQDTLDRPEQNSDDDENPHIKSKSTGRRRKMGSTRRNLRDRHEEKNTEKMQEDETGLPQIIQEKGPVNAEVVSEKDEVAELFVETAKEAHKTQEIKISYHEDTYRQTLPAAQNENVLPETLDVVDVSHKEELTEILTNPETLDVSEQSWTSDAPDTRQSRQDTLDRPEQNSDDDENPHIKSKSTGRRRKMGSTRRNLRDRHEEKNTEKMQEDETSLSQIIQVKTGGMTTEVDSSLEREDPIGSTERVSEDEKEKSLTGELENTSELTGYEEPEITEFLQSQSMLFHKEEDSQTSDKQTVSDCGDKGNRNSRQDTLDVLNPEVSQDQNTESISGDTQAARGEAYLEQTNEVKEMLEDFTVSDLMKIRPKHDVEEKDPISAEVVSEKDEVGEQFGDGEKEDHIAQELDISYEDTYSQSLPAAQNKNVLSETLDVFDISHEEDLKEIVTNPDVYEPQPSWTSDADAPDTRQSRQDTLDRPEQNSDDDENPHIKSKSTGRRRKMGSTRRNVRDRHEEKNTEKMQEDETSLPQIIQEKDPVNAEVVSEKDEVAELFVETAKEAHKTQEIKISYHEDTYRQTLPAAQNENVLPETLDVVDVSHKEELTEILTNPETLDVSEQSWTSDAPDTRQSRQDTLDRPEQNSDDDENPHIKSKSTGRRRKMGSTRRNLRDRHEEKNTEKMQEDETSLSQIIQVKTGGMTTEVDSSLEREDPIGSTERVSEDEKEKSLTGELENTSELTGYEEPEITEFLQSQTMLFHKEEDSQTSDKQTVSDCGDKGNVNSRQDTLDVLNPEVSQDQNTESISGDTQAARGEAYLEQTNEVKEMLEDFTVSDLMKIRPKHDVEEKDPISAEVVSEKDEVGEQFGDGENEDHIAQELDISYEDTYSQSLPAAQNKNVLSETLDVFDISHEEDLKEIVTNPDVYEPQPSWTSDADAPDTRQSRQDTLDRPEQNSDNDENPHIKSNSTGRRRKMGSTRRNLRDRHEEKNTEKMQEDETSLPQIIQEKDPVNAEVVSEKDEVAELFVETAKEAHKTQEIKISYHEDTYRQTLPAAQNENVLPETLDVVDVSHKEELTEILTNPETLDVSEQSWTSDAPDTRQSRQDTLDRPEQNSDNDENPHIKSNSTGRRRKMGSTRRNLRDRHEEKNTEKMQEDETSLSQIIQVKTGGMTTEVDSSLEREDPIGSTERVSEDEKEKSLTGELENTSELTGYEEPEITEFLQSQTMLFHKEEDSQTSDKQTVSDCGDKGNRNSRQDTFDVLNPEVSQDQNTESISGDTQAARGMIHMEQTCKNEVKETLEDFKVSDSIETAPKYDTKVEGDAQTAREEAYLEQANVVKETLEDFTDADLIEIRSKHDEEEGLMNAEVVSEKDEAGEQSGDPEPNTARRRKMGSTRRNLLDRKNVEVSEKRLTEKREVVEKLEVTEVASVSGTEKAEMPLNPVYLYMPRDLTVEEEKGQQEVTGQDQCLKASDLLNIALESNKESSMADSMALLCEEAGNTSQSEDVGSRALFIQDSEIRNGGEIVDDPMDLSLKPSQLDTVIITTDVHIRTTVFESNTSPPNQLFQSSPNIEDYINTDPSIKGRRRKMASSRRTARGAHEVGKRSEEVVAQDQEVTKEEAQELKSEERSDTEMLDLEMVKSEDNGGAREGDESASFSCSNTSLMQENNVSEGADNTKSEIETSQESNTTSRRRKMGSTRRSLGVRPEEENVDVRQEAGTEVSDIAKDVENATIAEHAFDVENTENEFEKQEQKSFEAVTEFSHIPCASHLIPMAHQSYLESKEPPEIDAQQVDTVHHLNPSNLPSKSSLSPKNGVQSEVKVEGRRRKMGSTRMSHRLHKDPAEEEEEMKDAGLESITAESDQRAESTGLPEKTEVDKSDQRPPSNNDYGTRENSGTADCLSQRAPGQPAGPGDQLVQEREKTLGNSEEFNLGPNQFNVVMIGNSDVGKTSFINRAQNGEFCPDLSATIGIDTSVQSVTVDGKTVVLQLWDTAGQERFRSITRQVFHRAQAFLLMYDITSSQSFCDVRYWVTCIQEGAADDVTIVLLGNKSDCAKRQVHSDQAEALAKEYNIHFMECSAATGENVIQSMENVARMLSQKAKETEAESQLFLKEPQRKNMFGCC